MHRLDNVTVRAYISTRVCMGLSLAFDRLQIASSMCVSSIVRWFVKLVVPLKSPVFPRIFILTSPLWLCCINPDIPLISFSITHLFRQWVIMGVSIYDSPQEKVGFTIPLFEAGIRLLTSGFFNMIVDHYGFSIDELTPSVVNKIIDFEPIFRSLGCRFLKTRDYPDRLPKLFGSKLTLGKRLRNITAVGENLEDSVLAAASMSAAWRARWKMTQLYVVRCSAKVEISLEMALRSHYRGRLYHGEIDLVEALPPHVSERRILDFVVLLLVEGGNAGSNRPALPSRPTVRVISPVRLLAPTPSGLFVVVQASPSPYAGSPLVNLDSGSMSGVRRPPTGFVVPVKMIGSCKYCKEKGVLESEFPRCQHHLARAHVDGAVARGGLQWMLEKGVVCVIDKVIESAEFDNRIQGVREAREALGFEKGKQLGGYSTSSENLKSQILAVL
ncbi:unnamed protein product [Lactuca saligna]|uniref:Uncharacterized protein n=1 Tax=Lactuca saligna TaxID=75948 RepID=A0AA35ZS71_LACSI|nr:unnamed protein product [Lactuca saligna]